MTAQINIFDVIEDPNEFLHSSYKNLTYKISSQASIDKVAIVINSSGDYHKLGLDVGFSGGCMKNLHKISAVVNSTAPVSLSCCNF